jgi:hypothetical protein
MATSSNTTTDLQLILITFTIFMPTILTALKIGITVTATMFDGIKVPRVSVLVLLHVLEQATNS